MYRRSNPGYKFKWKEYAHLIKTAEELMEMCNSYNDFQNGQGKCFNCPMGELCDELKPNTNFGKDFVFAVINQENRMRKLEKLLS